MSSEVSYYLVKLYREEGVAVPSRVYDCFESLKALHKEAYRLEQLPVGDPNKPFKISVQVETCVEYELYNEDN